jgi:hypothetical protein
MKITTDQLITELLGNLWTNFQRRVPFVRQYLQLVESKGGTFIMDHLAFRTFNTTTGEQPSGMMAISHLIKDLRYKEAGTYHFAKQKITANHFEHPDNRFPRIFVSQLEVQDFPLWAQHLIHEVVDDTPYILSDSAIELMNCVKSSGSINEEAAKILVEELTGYFRRPWNIPSKETILKINDISQYAAWVLLHGNSISHVSSLLNAQQVPEWPDLESTLEALVAAGIPMKREIAGEKGTPLRQAATLPVRETYLFPDGEGDFQEMAWTYAYFQLTQRGTIQDNNGTRLFPGFLGEQVSRLFKTTQTREN